MVAGGGIGGLATGIMLRKAGLEAVVLEHASDLKRVEVGAGITLWPNAVQMLDRLGVGEDVRARGALFTGSLEQRTSRGRLLSRWKLGEMGERLGATAVAVQRPILHAVLAFAAEESVRPGSEVTGFDDSDSVVTASLADGEVESGAALIGADGIESVIRAQLFGFEPPRFAGLTIWRALTELDDAALPPGTLVSWWGRAARFVAFRVGAGKMSWEASVASEPGGIDPPGGSKRAVLERFEGFCEPVEALVEATDEEAISRADVLDRPPSGTWGRGRVTLLGDAAHPMTFAVGQGAAQALEDAVVVAAALRDGEGDVESALRSYERRRAKRAAQFQAVAWRLARMGVPSGRLACGLRNAFLQGGSAIGRRLQERDLRLPE